MDGPIPWALQDVGALAKAERANRQLGAITSLAEIGGGMLRRGVTEYQDEKESPELAKLRAALGIQEEKAITQSQHPSEPGVPALTETAMSPGPWANDYVPGGTTTLRSELKPTVPTPSGPLGGPPVTGSLQRLGGIGMAALGLPSPAARARQMTLARLQGQVERQKLQAGLTGKLGRTIAGAQDPAAAIAALTRGPGGDSWTGLHPGDIPMKPGAVGRAPTPLELQMRDDPAAKAALAAETARQKDIRGAGRSTHKTTADLAVEAAGGDPQRALDLLQPFSLGAIERAQKAESHPESDQGGSDTPPADKEAGDVKEQFSQELGGHPTRAHAAQRTAAIIRSARGIELTQ